MFFFSCRLGHERFCLNCGANAQKCQYTPEISFPGCASSSFSDFDSFLQGKMGEIKRVISTIFSELNPFHRSENCSVSFNGNICFTCCAQESLIGRESDSAIWSGSCGYVSNCGPDSSSATAACCAPWSETGSANETRPWKYTNFTLTLLTGSGLQLRSSCRCASDWTPIPQEQGCVTIWRTHKKIGNVPFFFWERHVPQKWTNRVWMLASIILVARLFFYKLPAQQIQKIEKKINFRKRKTFFWKKGRLVRTLPVNHR